MVRWRPPTSGWAGSRSAPGRASPPGQRLGTLGPAGRLRLGARRAGDRRGYLDPLSLLADDRPAPPRLGPAPRALRLRPAGPRPAASPPAFAPAPAIAARRLPWPAYPALALVASTLPVGGLVRRRRRRRDSLTHRARAAPYAPQAPG